ncbi:MAG: Ig-like domain-containing protein [Cellvibrionaceae bacterium]|nr:Ig-like domain-containing protein [Cellvibrionaceae bacterium]
MMKKSVVFILMSFTLTVFAASYPPNIDYGDAGHFCQSFGKTFGRAANIMAAGPFIVSQPETIGSTSVGLPDGNIYHDTVWEFGDNLCNDPPVKIYERDEGGTRSAVCQPVQAHGTYIEVLPTLGARVWGCDSTSYGWDPTGATALEQIDIQPWPSTFPVFQETGFISQYSFELGLSLRWIYAFPPDEPIQFRDLNFLNGREQSLDDAFMGGVHPSWASWDQIALSGVDGFPILSGDLLFFSSDQRSLGIASYDIWNTQNPRLIDVFNPVLTEPDGNQVGVGGYWSDIWNSRYIVHAARPTRQSTDLSQPLSLVATRNYPSIILTDTADPENLALACYITFDQDAMGSVDPMYFNSQDGYGYVDRFRVDLDLCIREFPNDDNGRIDSGDAIYSQIVYEFTDIQNHAEASQLARPLGQFILFGGYDYSGTQKIITYTGSPLPENVYLQNETGVGFSILYHLSPGVAAIGNAALTVGDTIGPFGRIENTVTAIAVDERVNEQGNHLFIQWDEPDTQPPYVGGHRPLNGRVNYPIDRDIQISIHSTLRLETLNSAIAIRETVSGALIPSRFKISHTGVGTLDPLTDLTPGLSYTVSVTGIQDYMGNTMAPYSFSFTAGDDEPTRGISVVNPPVTRSPSYTGTAYYPNQSSELACEPDVDNGNVWVVNPDNDSVTIIDRAIGPSPDFVMTNTVLREIATGLKHPTSVTKVQYDAPTPSSYFAVTFRDSDKIVFYDPNGNQRFYVNTRTGGQPISSVSHDNYLYVALYGTGELLKIDVAGRQIVSRLTLGPYPRAMALTQEGTRLLVTRFISDPDKGALYDINTSATMALERTIAINKMLLPDSPFNGAGIPNGLASIVISQDETQALITAIKANIDRGTGPTSTGERLDGDNTVRPMIVTIDLVNNRDANVDPQTAEGTTDLDNAADPWYVSYLPNGQTSLVLLRGNNTSVFSDPGNNTSTFISTGFAPQSACATLRTLYVKNYTERTVSAIDISTFLVSGGQRDTTQTVSTVANEVLSPQVLQGKQIFNHSSIPAMGPEGYITCASCHFDACQDGQVYDMTQMGEGSRNTICLNGQMGTRFGDLHWTGNFDQVQDFAFQIRDLNQGDAFGLAFPNNATSLTANFTGQSPEMDALAAYVGSLGVDSIMRSYKRDSAGQLSQFAQNGESIFTAQNCQACHTPPFFTDGLLHDVGTSGGRPIATPTLTDLCQTPPYLHNGSAKTIEQVFVAGTTHNISGAISKSDQADLIDFICSVDATVFPDDSVPFTQGGN